MCSVPETRRIYCSPAPVSFFSGWYTIGHGPTGSRCLLVTRVNSPMRVPLPPARITPRMDMVASVFAVLHRVVAQVFLAVDRRDPGRVRPVPLHRFAQARREGFP